MNANGFKRLFNGVTVSTERMEATDTEQVFEAPTSEPQTPVRAASRPSRTGHAEGASSAAPDPEVVGARTRRRYSAAFKRRILEEADRCEAGQLGALLRREGLYSSTLQDFRRQQAQGSLDPATVTKRTADVAAQQAQRSAEQTRLLQLERENRRLKHQLRQAQTIIEFQKKLSELLGMPLESDPGDGREDGPIGQRSVGQ